MPFEAPDAFLARDVPEEDGFVAAGGCEASVIGCAGEVEDVVRVAGVGLDGFGYYSWGGRKGGGGALRWVPEVDFAVCAAGEEVG